MTTSIASNRIYPWSVVENLTYSESNSVVCKELSSKSGECVEDELPSVSGLDYFGLSDKFECAQPNIGVPVLEIDWKEQLIELLAIDHVFLFQSGTIATSSLLTFFLERSNHHIFVDECLHPLIYANRIDTLHFFHHNNVIELERLIGLYGPGIILISALSSVSGKIAPLKEFARIRTHTGSCLVVDESYSLGLFGPFGGTLCQYVHIQEHVDFVVASLANAFCCRAGILASQHRFLLEEIRKCCYHSNKSAGLSNYELRKIAWTLKTVRLIECDRKSIATTAERIYSCLHSLNFCAGRCFPDQDRDHLHLSSHNVVSPIICFVCPSKELACRLYNKLCNYAPKTALRVLYAPFKLNRHVSVVSVTISSHIICGNNTDILLEALQDLRAEYDLDTVNLSSRYDFGKHSFTCFDFLFNLVGLSKL